MLQALLDLHRRLRNPLDTSSIGLPLHHMHTMLRMECEQILGGAAPEGSSQEIANGDWSEDVGNVQGRVPFYKTILHGFFSGAIAQPWVHHRCSSTRVVTSKENKKGKERQEGGKR